MRLKNIMAFGATAAMLVSTVAYADVSARPASAKVAHLKRARSAADPRKSENFAGVSTPLLLVGVVAVGVGAAAAAGAFNSSS